uniref:Uncharacterized protein n=1 Tax=Oryza brachyantha TaxID=4533 RepID=J3KTZ1_ORYBR
MRGAWCRPISYGGHLLCIHGDVGRRYNMFEVGNLLFPEVALRVFEDHLVGVDDGQEDVYMLQGHPWDSFGVSFGNLGGVDGGGFFMIFLIIGFGARVVGGDIKISCMDYLKEAPRLCTLLLRPRRALLAEQSTKYVTVWEDVKIKHIMGLPGGAGVDGFGAAACPVCWADRPVVASRFVESRAW